MYATVITHLVIRAFETIGIIMFYFSVCLMFKTLAASVISKGKALSLHSVPS